MAYPGEKKHKRYMDYAINESSAGRKPQSKRDWAATTQAATKNKKPKKK